MPVSDRLYFSEIKKNVASLKRQTKTPVLVGFGIKSRKDALAISTNTNADGIIIGSALIQKYFDLQIHAQLVQNKNFSPGSGLFCLISLRSTRFDFKCSFLE